MSEISSQDDDEIIVTYELFDELNKDGPCIVFNEEKSERLGKKCYSIKKFCQIQPSMEVTIASINGSILNRDSFYYCLRCIRSPRSNVAYPDGTIVSVRWKIKKRLVYKGFFGKAFVVPMLDVFVDGRSVCIRFYEDSIHIAGKMNGKNIEKVCKIAVGILEDALGFWKKCHENKKLFLEVTEWLEKTAQTKHSKIVIEDEEGNEEKDYIMTWPSFAPEEYLDFATEIIDRYADIRYVSELMKRTRNIIELEEPPATDHCEVTKIGTSLYRCIYELGFPIDVSNLVQMLFDQGYEVTNYDVEGPDARLQIIDRNEYEDDHLINRKGNKFWTQFLSFSAKGKIQHSGTGHKRHEEAYNKLMKDIVTFFG